VKISIRITNNFSKAAMPLLKRYASLPNDLLLLEKELLENPRLGTSIGKDIYKIRLKIKSKGKGKSGGGRIISLLETDVIVYEERFFEEEITVNLISIYDKSEISNISEKALKDLIKNFLLE
jgi:hypothetical protein